MYRLGRKLGFTAGAVFSAALLWSLHPLHTLDVTYISSTPEPLYTLFSLLGLLALLPDISSRKLYISIVLVLLALGSKETAVVFPALLTGCLFISSKDRLKPALYVRTWPFWLLSALYAVIYTHTYNGSLFESHSPDLEAYAHQIIPRIMTCLATLPVYLKLIIYPTNLHMERYFLVLGLFFTMLSSSPRREEPVAQSTAIKNERT